MAHFANAMSPAPRPDAHLHETLSQLVLDEALPGGDTWRGSFKARVASSRGADRKSVP